MNSRLLLSLALLTGPACSQDASVSPPAAAASSQSGFRCNRVLPLIPRSFFKNPIVKSASVVVEVEILPPGEVGDVVIKESSGNKDWEVAVIAAIKALNCSVTHRIVARQTLSYTAP